LIFELVCFAISLSGLVIRGIAIGYAQAGTSGRNTEKQIADNLNIKGLYSVCRHPLYLGNILLALGVMLFTKSLMFAAAGTFAYVLVYERIIAAEEQFLVGKFGDAYRQWTTRTPLLIPRFTLWVKPGLPFSLKMAIRGEFYGFTALVVTMFLLSALKAFTIQQELAADMFWLSFAAIALMLFLTMRFLRKHTRFLDVKERREEPLQ
jgi:isoprenylcysteine carboxyl methyltransferase (ICMT) family protein YpbQ